MRRNRETEKMRVKSGKKSSISNLLQTDFYLSTLTNSSRTPGTESYHVTSTPDPTVNRTTFRTFEKSKRKNTHRHILNSASQQKQLDLILGFCFHSPSRLRRGRSAVVNMLAFQTKDRWSQLFRMRLQVEHPPLHDSTWNNEWFNEQWFTLSLGYWMFRWQDDNGRLESVCYWCVEL